MSLYRVPRMWRLPETALRQSMVDMALDGKLRREGVAMWLGRHDEVGIGHVTHVVLLRGPGVIKEFDFLQISADLVNEVSDLALQVGAMLVGQIHSHAPGYGVELSVADRTLGIVVPGYLSAVAPDFAQGSAILGEIGFHLFENGRWRRLTRAELTDRVIIDAGAGADVLVAGGGQ